MKKVVVLTGAGISAESGLKTFRGNDGLWEGYAIEDVATPEAWQRNPVLVQNFYNMRRKAVLEAKPNAAHLALTKLEDCFDVTIITQNVDNLHERAGSTNVIHLHGIVTKSQSCMNPALVYDISGPEIKMGELCELGSQLRPHIVWFGEPVPMIEKAAEICMQADIFIVIGTSLQVYPAAGLITLAPEKSVKYLIDPESFATGISDIRVLKENAGTGVPKVVEELILRCSG